MCSRFEMMRDVLRRTLSQPIESLSPQFVTALLTTPECANTETTSLSAYPFAPLADRIADTLSAWENSPPLDFPSFHLLAETQPFQFKLSQMSPITVGLPGRLEGLADEEQIAEMRGVLSELGEAGLLTLLGMRTTIGSVMRVPPSRDELVAAFQQHHSSPMTSSVLTVGGRALSKHCHRSGDGWWGQTKGGEATINQFALDTLNRILDQATWRNMHMLPHEIVAFELRVTEGYGARWSMQEQEWQFRGFLEPQMEDGHEKGWRHGQD